MPILYAPWTFSMYLDFIMHFLPHYEGFTGPSIVKTLLFLVFI